jgi:hypothetical protein
LEANFHFQPSTCVIVELARISIKEGLIFSLEGISRVGMMSFEQSKYQPHWRRWEVNQSFNKSFRNIVLLALGSRQMSKSLGSWWMAPWNNKTQ